MLSQIVEISCQGKLYKIWKKWSSFFSEAAVPKLLHSSCCSKIMYKVNDKRKQSVDYLQSYRSRNQNNVNWWCVAVFIVEYKRLLGFNLVVLFLIVTMRFLVCNLSKNVKFAYLHIVNKYLWKCPFIMEVINLFLLVCDCGKDLLCCFEKLGSLKKNWHKLSQRFNMLNEHCRNVITF